jgi:hypothetical protein
LGLKSKDEGKVVNVCFGGTWFQQITEWFEEVIGVVAGQEVHWIQPGLASTLERLTGSDCAGCIRRAIATICGQGEQDNLSKASEVMDRAERQFLVATAFSFAFDRDGGFTAYHQAGRAGERPAIGSDLSRNRAERPSSLTRFPLQIGGKK